MLKAPVLNATATGLAGAAFGAIGMPGVASRAQPRRPGKVPFKFCRSAGCMHADTRPLLLQEQKFCMVRAADEHSVQAAPKRVEAAADEDAVAELEEDGDEDAEVDDVDNPMHELIEPEEATSSGAQSDDAGPGLLNGRAGPSQVCCVLICHDAYK